MSVKSQKFPIPLSLIVIDGVGAMLVAWGFYLYVSESRGVLHIFAGFILMLPLVIHILNLTQNRNKQQKVKQNGKP